MSLLIARVIGVVIGGAGSLLLVRNFDVLLISILTGVVGAILGLGLYGLVGNGSATTGSLFSAVGTLCEVIGALIGTLLFCALHSTRQGPTPIETDDREDDE